MLTCVRHDSIRVTQPAQIRMVRASGHDDGRGGMTFDPAVDLCVWLGCLGPNTVPGHEVATLLLSFISLLRFTWETSTRYRTRSKASFRHAAEGVCDGVLEPVSSLTHGFNIVASRSVSPCSPFLTFRHDAGLNRNFASGSSDRCTLRLLPTHGQVHCWHMTVSEFARSLLFQYGCTSTLKSLTYHRSFAPDYYSQNGMHAFDLNHLGFHWPTNQYSAASLSR